MVKKNLNKKVGCALIAAGLLAASSVQGSVSGVHERVITLKGKSRQIGSMNVNFGYPDGFSLGILSTRVNEEGEAEEVLVVLVKKTEKGSLEKLPEQGFPGLELCTDGIFKIYSPSGIGSSVIRQPERNLTAVFFLNVDRNG